MITRRISLFALLALMLVIGGCNDDGPVEPRGVLTPAGSIGASSEGEPTPKDEEFRDHLQAGYFTICKVAEGATIEFEFTTLAVGPGVATAPVYEPTVFLGHDECADVYQAPAEDEVDADQVTITEVVPDGWQVDRVFIWSLDEVEPEVFETTYHELPAGTTQVSGSIDAFKQGCVVIFYNSERPTHEGCSRTPGYWKTHPEAWPVDEITIGGVTHTREEALEILWQPERGDKSRTMFRALLAAMLNELNGADTICVEQEMSDADDWLASYPVGSNVRGNSDAWKDGESLSTMLDDYNNGRLCVPHCEDEDDDDDDDDDRDDDDPDPLVSRG